MADKQRTEIDAVLLEELRLRADELGRTETEVLEEAVRRYLLDRPAGVPSAERDGVRESMVGGGMIG